MRLIRNWTWIALLTAWLLAACTQNTPPATISEQAPPQETTAGKIKIDQSGCTVVSRQPTPDPTQQALIPPVGENDWVKGSDQATVTLLEYSDFQ